MTLKKLIPVAMLVVILAAPLPAGAEHHGHEHEHDDPVGYVVQNHWSGFISCGAGSPVVVTMGDCIKEGQNDIHHAFAAEEGLKTLVVALDWEPSLPTSNSLQIYLGGGLEDHAAGSPPIEFRLDEGDDFDPFSGELGLDFTVFPGNEPSVFYQQPFTVFYHEFYGEHAPEGYSALPDE